MYMPLYVEFILSYFIRRKDNAEANDRLKPSSPDDNDRQDNGEMSDWERQRQEELERERREEEERRRKEEEERRKHEEDREKIAEEAKLLKTNSDEVGQKLLV